MAFFWIALSFRPFIRTLGYKTST